LVFFGFLAFDFTAVFFFAAGFAVFLHPHLVQEAFFVAGFLVAVAILYSPDF